jgi:LysR family transcriptional regulator, transcriptional activator of the cysJI operon
MVVEHLKLFRNIVESRSVSRGAEQSGVSQSAASQHLHEVERLLGVSILDRSTRPFQLTEAGALYYEFCRDVLRLRQELDEALDALRNRRQYAVRVAAIYSVGLSDMSRLEAELARRMPDVEILVEYLHPEEVYEAVRDDRADLGLISYPKSNREIAAIQWRSEKMMLAAAPSHPLAGRSSISLADLDDRAFVAFDDSLQVGREVKKYLRENGAQVNVVMHFDNIQTMKEALALGTCVSILPVRVLRNEIELGHLVAVPIENCRLVRPLGIIHRRRKKFNPGIDAFLELLREEAAQESAHGA